MTGGYFGSGYRTTIWEYEQAKLAGLKGESVELRLLEKTSLPTGKIMLYRKSVDVHRQEHADEFSISLNLMVIPNETVMNRATQFIFEVEQGTVTSTISLSSGRVMLCELAEHVGDGRTGDLLDSLATKHPDSRVRAACTKSLIKLNPSREDDLRLRAGNDPHGFVRAMASNQQC